MNKEDIIKLLEEHASEIAASGHYGWGYMLSTAADALAALEARAAAEKERDALRARLAEMEAQEPAVWVRPNGVGWLPSGVAHLGKECPPGWVGAATCYYARPVPAASVPDDVAKFLLGEAALDGVWFGDPHPTERGNFWWRKWIRAAPAGAEVARDAVAEAIRKAFTKLPRYSFIHSAGAVGSVRDPCGAWADWVSVHELFDPVAVDTAMSATAASSDVEQPKAEAQKCPSTGPTGMA